MNTPIQKRSERDEQRRMAAAELFAEGLANAEIGRRLHVSRPSVSKWHQIWQAKGTEGLKVRPVERLPLTTRSASAAPTPCGKGRSKTALTRPWGRWNALPPCLPA